MCIWFCFYRLLNLPFLYILAAHNQALADVNVANSNPALPGLITESENTIF